MLGSLLPDWALITISIVICAISVVIDITIQHYENN